MKIFTLTLFSILGLSDLAIAQVKLDSGLIAYYPFDGNTNDATNGKHHLTNVNATLTTDKDGNTNRAYYFNGTSAYMHGAANSADFSISSFSCSFWLNPASGQNHNCRLFAVTEGSTFLHRYFSWIEGNGYNQYGVAGMTSSGQYSFYDLSASTYQPNIWSHIVVTYYNNTTRIYINGVLNKTRSQTGGIQGFSSDLLLLVGGAYHPSTPVSLYKGAMDELRIYNRQLSADEITTLSGAARTGLYKKVVSKNISVYPNPVNMDEPVLFIEAAGSSTFSYEIYNQLGKQVQKGTTANNAIILESTIIAGTYWIKVCDENGVYSNKIFVSN